MALPLLNVPEINRIARALGDFSSLTKTGIPVQRGINRAVGRAAGKTFGFVNARFGVFGMIATAQFFAVLRQALAIQSVEQGKYIYIGSAASYAAGYHNGSLNYPARPFLRNAILQTPFWAGGSKKRFRVPTTVSGLRTGLYQGQKFVDDFAAFFRGDIGRFARREAGKQISAFFWSGLRIGAEEKRPNVLMGYLNRVAKQSRKNIRLMGEDTGTLRHSIATGFTAHSTAEASRKQMAEWLVKRGKANEIPQRVLMRYIPPGEGTGSIPNLVPK